MRYKPSMRMWQSGLAVLIWGLALGMLMWGSGADVALQRALNTHEPLWLNHLARVVSDFGLGRNQILACLTLGLALGFRGLQKQSGAVIALRQLPRWALGSLHQLYLWARLRFVWTPLWQGLPRTPRLLLLAIPVFAVAGICNIILKLCIGRPRPKEILWNNINPYQHLPFGDAGYMSFPSGHTATTAAIAIVVAQVLPARWRWVVWLWVVVVGAARVLTVTSHYAGDVIAGAALGGVVGWVLLKLMGVRRAG
jgi:membrane-associated phospholipid phosphatase